MDESSQITCSKCRRTVSIRKEPTRFQNICPHCGAFMFVEPDLVRETTGRDALNMVSDIATGVNVRKKDNLYQLATIGISLLLGITIGFFCTRDHGTGVLVGGFLGVLVGLFGSGIFLMIYRFIRHIQGHHK